MEKIKVGLLLMSLFTQGFQAVFAQNDRIRGTIEGRVVDSETQSPLIGANVSVASTVLGAATDMEGHFEILNAPVGSYALKIGYVGYETVFKTDVIVRSQRQTTVNVQLKMKAMETEAVSVTAGYFPASDDQPVSAIQFSSEEIRRAPGAGGDVSRILFSLPSVAKVNDQSNSLIVRGGNPIENTFFIDNIEVPNINHFPDQATSGGPIGMINVDFIDDVSFYTGGFSVAYGDKLSSVMDITFREGSRSGYEAQLDLNFAGFGGVAEGPVGKNGSWMFSARRSYLDMLVKTINIGTSVAPRYGDYQGKLVYDLYKSHRLTFLGLFGDDHNAPSREVAEENQMSHYGCQDVYSRTGGVNWRALWGGAGYSNTSISVTSQKFNEDWYETATGHHDIKNRSTEREIRLRNVNHFRISPAHQFEFGYEAKVYQSEFDNVYDSQINALGNPVPAVSIREKVSALKQGGFLTYSVTSFQRFTANIGLRADYFYYNSQSDWSPRFSFSYRLTEITTLNGSTGLYYQAMPLHLLSRHEANKSLRNAAARHWILGVEHLLTPETRLTVEAYQKKYNHFPMDPAQPDLFLLDEGYRFSEAALIDVGEARTRGVELTLQKKMASRFYGLVSFSYFRAKYKGLGGGWIDRKYDNRFIFSLQGGYKPNNSWEFSLRWIYAGGSPYTPIDSEASRLSQRMVVDASRINAIRYPDYHSLNVRFDKRFYSMSRNLIVYLSMWNVYNRKNIAEFYWNDKEQKTDVIYQWLMLPIFGIEYEF